MNKALLFYISCTLFFTSCKIGKNDHAYNVNYKDWKGIVLKEIDKEVAGAPHTCGSLESLGNSYKDLINAYDFTKNMAYLDTLTRVEKFNPKTNELILIEVMQYNFAFVHATYYLVYKKRKKKVKGFELIRSDPDPIIAVNDTADRRVIIKSKRYFSEYFTKKTDCGELGRIYVVTTLDGSYNIKSCHVALLPTTN